MANKKKKIRVGFRKNRGKPARRNDLTRKALDEGIDRADVPSGERISGKGALTRRRTVIGVEADEGEQSILIDVDEASCLVGRVLSSTGLNTIVQGTDGCRYECTVRGVVRQMARDARNAVVTGDEVLFRPVDENAGVIERVNPRRSTLSRGSQRKEHVIVANVDQVLIVVSAADPPLKPNLVDRFLISAEKGSVRSVICINKIDLVASAGLQAVAGTYGRLGYEVVLASAVQSTGVQRLRSVLKGKETVLTGQSGVGKSSLLNAVQPGLTLRTAAVSGWTGKGTHTTRRAELLELEFGGWVVDTPGIRQLELWDVIPEEVEGYFVEFRPFVPLCRFPDCSHTHEEGCGVKQAVVHELISRSRYESYCRILDDAPA